MTTFSNDDPPSPCVSVCVLNPRTGFCEGCLRNMDEISGWPNFSAEEKRTVLASIEERCERAIDSTLFD